MPLLFYWRPDNYRDSLAKGFDYHLNQDSPLLHEVEIGDSVWAFTRAEGGSYALAAQLIVETKTLNRPGFDLGKYRIWGDLLKSRYFKVENQTGLEEIIRMMSIQPKAEFLGQSFQGRAAVKKINVDDHVRLVDFAKTLPLEL